MKLLSVVIILFVFLQCDAEASCIDKRFSQDIIGVKYDDFHFVPKNIPVVGKTKTSDLEKLLDARGPSTRWAYLIPFRMRLGDKIFLVDSMLSYTSLKRFQVKGQNYYGYDQIGYLSLTLYIFKGDVKGVDISQRVRKSVKDKWANGKYHSKLTPQEILDIEQESSLLEATYSI